MLSKARRIQKSFFKKILVEGKRYNSVSLLLYLSLNDKRESPTKFSFSVSKKVLKGAVNRNLYRRRGYSIIGRNIKNIKSGYLCFFSFKKGSNKLTFNFLEKEVLNLLNLSGVLDFELRNSYSS